jgi:hypothetical protein
MANSKSKQRPKTSKPRQRTLKDAIIPAPNPAKPEGMHRAEAHLLMELINENEAEQSAASGK